MDTSAVMPTPFLRRCYQRVQPAVEALFGFPELWRLYDAARIGEPSPAEFAERLLNFLQIDWDFDEGEIRELRSHSRPLIVLANHPFGGADSLAFVQLLEIIRPGAWRMLSNQVICSVPEFGQHLIAVDPLSSEGGSAMLNRRGLASAMRHLRSGGVLGLFPAGRVSHLMTATDAVADRPWSDHAVRLAAATGAKIAVLHIPGQNSARFLLVPPQWRRLRALMLCRELTQPALRTLHLRLATVLKPEEIKRLAPQTGAGAKLQAWYYLRADADIPRPKSASSHTLTVEPTDTLAPLIDQPEDGQRGIPPLMRYYCSLGAKFLAYHVESSFADALYCLLRVDLSSIPVGYQRRFLK